MYLSMLPYSYLLPRCTCPCYPIATSSPDVPVHVPYLVPRCTCPCYLPCSQMYLSMFPTWFPDVPAHVTYLVPRCTCPCSLPGSQMYLPMLPTLFPDVPAHVTYLVPRCTCPCCLPCSQMYLPMLPTLFPDVALPLSTNPVRLVGVMLDGLCWLLKVVLSSLCLVWLETNPGACWELYIRTHHNLLHHFHVTSLHAQIRQILRVTPDKKVWTRKGLSSAICRECFAKLNRLAKIDFELTTRQKQLTEEKEALLTLLRPKQTCLTPVKPGLKRSLVKTPTPKKLVKRPLLRTPVKCAQAAPSRQQNDKETQRHGQVATVKYMPMAQLPVEGCMPLRQQNDKETQGHGQVATVKYMPMAQLPVEGCMPLKVKPTNHDKYTQCGSSQQDPVGTVKVVIIYPSGKRTRVVKDSHDAKYLRALVDGLPAKRLAGIVYRDPKFRPLLHRQTIDKYIVL
ncbi:hypothetical protein Bbelb_394040 [Branchiostoma belcheri]|nr:hypothetical protein Bbelb_394040 [Branchiostoma belcheri]